MSPAAALSQPSAPIGTAFTESRIATQDGYLWPLPRDRMVSRGAVRERMVEDLDGLRRARLPDECVTDDDLIRLGWHPEQVLAHAPAAFAAHKAALKPARAERQETRAERQASHRRVA